MRECANGPRLVSDTVRANKPHKMVFELGVRTAWYRFSYLPHIIHGLCTDYAHNPIGDGYQGVRTQNSCACAVIKICILWGLYEEHSLAWKDEACSNMLHSTLVHTGSSMLLKIHTL